MTGWLEIYGVINEEMKCYEIGVDRIKGMDYMIPKTVRVKEIWTISALWHCINLLAGHLIENEIQFMFVAELRLKK